MKKSIALVAVSVAFFGLGSGFVRIPLQIGSPLVAQSKTSSGDGAPRGNDHLLQLSDRFEAVAAKIIPAVVSVEAVKPAKANGNGGAGGKSKPVEESGSGVIVKLDAKPGYYVVTNNHVVQQARTDQITIHLTDGRLFRPAQVWADPETDIAVMSLDGAVNLPIATLGNSDNAKIGRWVLAVGSPFGLNQSVSHGIISARDRGQVSLGNTIRIKEFLQTDAAINPGSSGGPLVDMNGEVIGINTAIASHNGSNSGVSFSIPTNLVKRVVNQLVQGEVKRGYLGMQLASAFEAKDAIRLGLDRVQGALVEKVYAQTPAADAGLQADDVIVQIDSIAIRTENHLINMISSLPPGQRVRLQVWRNRGLATVDAVVGDWGKAQSRVQAP